MFTDEEIEILKNNKYVKRVSKTTITYTEEFKKEFITRYQAKIKPSKILKELGFNPCILKQDRIKSITRRCKIYATRKDGLKDRRMYNFRRPLSLEQEVIRLRQENEFLKKIDQLYMNAQEEKLK